MPRSWVNNNKLKKGDLISINDQGHELVLEVHDPNKKEEISEVTLQGEGKELERIKAEIEASYLNGYDTIHISSKNLDDISHDVKGILRNLSGMEIMEHNSSRITAKSIINLNEVSIENIVRRMDVITRSMIEDTILGITGGDKHITINQRETDLHRLYFLGCRTIKNAIKTPRVARLIGKGAWELHSDKTILMRLERIADCQKRTARLLSGLRINREFMTELQSLYTTFKERYEKTMKSYYNKDKENSIDVDLSSRIQIEKCNNFLQKINNAMVKGKGKNDTYLMQTALSIIIEHLKTSNAQLKYMARYIICYD